MARITVVNDYPAFLELVRDMLSATGHQATTMNGQEATIEEIAASRPDLLIIDVMVHSQASTGWDVIALVRSHAALEELPIVVATGDVIQTRERLDELERFGNLYVLDKPFEASTFYDTVQRAMGAAPS